MVETEKKQEMMADRQTRAQETLVLKQEAAEQALSEQNKQAEQTKNLQQGISMKATVFTFVTTVFLPLSFLTSVRFFIPAPRFIHLSAPNFR